MNDKYCIDSNILVYSIDSTENTKFFKAREFLEHALLNPDEACISTQNLNEFVFVSTQKIQRPILLEQAKTFVSNFYSSPSFTVYTHTISTTLLAIDISQKYGIHYWDALIVAVMQENGIYKIATENVKDFSKVPWIEVIDVLGNGL
ncbi:MAG: putative nucleic acid-binding protein [Patescibacteria group bacterium]|jgi:predicted nucleic acid-binding protein